MVTGFFLSLLWANVPAVVENAWSRGDPVRQTQATAVQFRPRRITSGKPVPEGCCVNGNARGRLYFTGSLFRDARVRRAETMLPLLSADWERERREDTRNYNTRVVWIRATAHNYEKVRSINDIMCNWWMGLEKRDKKRIRKNYNTWFAISRGVNRKHEWVARLESGVKTISECCRLHWDFEENCVMARIS